MSNLCLCGCGNPTRLPNHKYLCGHQNKNKNGMNAVGWKGGVKNDNGYVAIFKPDHPKNRSGYVLEHVIMAEKALGKYLPDNAVVHHINGIRNDNRPENLVILQDNSYHRTIHKRTKALEICGNADFEKCAFCKEYDNPINLVHQKNSTQYHQECMDNYQRDYYKRKVGDASQQTRTKK